MKHVFLLVLAVAFGALLPVRAAASDTYPAVVQKELGLAEQAGPGKGCTICHRDDNGMLNTATKPFARSLIASGTAGASVPSLRAALRKLEQEGIDSDQDGVGDIDELRAGTDPNLAMTEDGEVSSPIDEVPLMQTGCSLTASPGGTSPCCGALLALAALWSARRLTRRE